MNCGSGFTEFPPYSMGNILIIHLRQIIIIDHYVLENTGNWVNITVYDMLTMTASQENEIQHLIDIEKQLILINKMSR